MNNKDWLCHLGRDNYEGIELMLHGIDPEEIVLSCSPRHVQSVIEDLRAVALGMAVKLKANQEKGHAE